MKRLLPYTAVLASTLALLIVPLSATAVQSNTRAYVDPDTGAVLTGEAARQARAEAARDNRGAMNDEATLPRRELDMTRDGETEGLHQLPGKRGGQAIAPPDYMQHDLKYNEATGYSHD